MQLPHLDARNRASHSEDSVAKKSPHSHLTHSQVLHGVFLLRFDGLDYTGERGYCPIL